MPQVLKPSVRDAILRAAAVAFARDGFHGASMAAIAREAGVSAGNVYRYFGGKQALFEAVLPGDVAAALEAVLARRVDALVALDDPGTLDAAARAAQADFLRFLVDHRLQVVLLLDRAEGTDHEGFGDRFVDGLVARALPALDGPAGPHTAFVLRRVFDGARRTLVDVLETYDEPTDIASALSAFWTFQIAGLAALRRSAP